MYFFAWNWSNARNIWPALWVLMAWCFSTRTSVASVLSIHPCVSRFSWVNMHHRCLIECQLDWLLGVACGRNIRYVISSDNQVWSIAQLFWAFTHIYIGFRLSVHLDVNAGCLYDNFILHSVIIMSALFASISISWLLITYWCSHGILPKYSSLSTRRAESQYFRYLACPITNSLVYGCTPCWSV